MRDVVSNYFVEPGDRLLIEAVEIDSEFAATGDQEVMVDGSIDLGKFGRIRVAGMTVEAIEEAITNQIHLVSGKTEVVNVQLIETNGSRVYVLGAVGSPGTYDLNGNETVLDGILKAGGLTSKAAPCSILLVRPTGDCECRVVLPICYRQITQLGDATTNYQLQPGDRIVVGERTFWEEIAVWKQSQECPRCDRSPCVQRAPARIDYANRFNRWLTPFALPLSKPDAKTTDESSPETTTRSGDNDDSDQPDRFRSSDTSNSTPSDLQPAESNPRETVPQRDSGDFYLPPAQP